MDFVASNLLRKLWDSTLIPTIGAQIAPALTALSKLGLVLSLSLSLVGWDGGLRLEILFQKIAHQLFDQIPIRPFEFGVVGIGGV